MAEIYDSGKHTGQFDHVWPRLNSAFEKLAQSVEEEFAGISIDARAFKLVGYRFQAYIVFSKKSSSMGASNEIEVGIVASCGSAFTVTQDLSVSARRNSIACSTELVERKRNGGGHILNKGPTTEFDLDSDTRISALTGQWVDATVTFIRQNEPAIIRELGR